MRVLAPLLALALLGCWPSAAPPPAIHAPALPNDVRWVRTSAEYRGLAGQTYRLASGRVAELASGLPPRSWAVILDADETVLDNSEYQRRLTLSGQRYSEDTWAMWVKERAALAIPGAVEFAARVRELTGRLVIVTNRADSLCAATRENLQTVGFPADLVLCKPVGESDKNPRFRRVQSGQAAPGLPALTVVAWMGDNIQDFPGLNQESRLKPETLRDFGVRFFLFPNPMYGSWERNPDP
ncbi:MAG: HAD family acid phosphatase [Gemmatimonadaceae bacterium]